MLSVVQILNFFLRRQHDTNPFLRIKRATRRLEQQTPLVRKAA
jgi:hypothetical protein